MPTLEQHQSFKLGRKAVVRDSRTPFLRDFLLPAPPAPPIQCVNSKGVLNWGMMLNDQLGCCTIAGCGHAVQVWELASTGQIVFIDDNTIRQYYEQWDGYNPSIPGTDQGGIELNVLKQWSAGGFASNPLTGFVGVTPTNQTHVMQAINYFGGAYIGVALPSSAQGQAVWDVGNGPDGEPGSWGGHCVFVCDYGPQGLTCITWGAPQLMTWSFFFKYVDEAYALLSPDFLTQGVSPLGLNLPMLLNYLEAIQ